MDIYRSADRMPLQGHDQWFTGEIRMMPIVAAAPPGRPSMVQVTFSAGARTNWHTHPLGQTLIITAGRGRAQTEGGPVIELLPGDVIWFPAGERHWHGAAPDAEMTHIAVQSMLDGKTVDWEEPVSEVDYQGANQ
jgi:quercetin dioxygenase-like cupin family protein